MALMTNGKKVVAIGIGGNEFYSIGENADGLMNIDGQTYKKSLIGRGVTGLSNATQYYLTGSYGGWIFTKSTTSTNIPDFGVIAEEFKTEKWNVVAIKTDTPKSPGNLVGPGNLVDTYGKGIVDYGEYNLNVAWFAVSDLKISDTLFTDTIANQPTSFSFPLNTYSISVADSSFAVTPLSQITSNLQDTFDGVVLGNDSQQYLHLSSGDCFVKLSDVTNEKDDQVGQNANLPSATEAYYLSYSDHKYNFTDQKNTTGVAHPEAIMNARFVINGTQFYHTNVTGYESNWFKRGN